MAKIFVAYRMLVDVIDEYLMVLIDYLMIFHRFVIDYTTHTISSNFFFKLISGDKNFNVHGS